MGRRPGEFSVGGYMFVIFVFVFCLGLSFYVLVHLF